MNKPKFEMTGNKDLDCLLTNINNGADVNIRDNDGAEVDIKYKRGDTALIYASNNGYIDLSKQLIENGAKINTQNNFGTTALIGASWDNYIDICKLLIENGADINIQNIYGYTALISASLNENISVCKFLIENGADINIKDKYGYTAIDTMKEYGIYKQVEPYKILGVKYFHEVFKDRAESYMDIFETSLYSQEIGLEEIKDNIDMFYSNVVARMADKIINESVEL